MSELVCIVCCCSLIRGFNFGCPEGSTLKKILNVAGFFDLQFSVTDLEFGDRSTLLWTFAISLGMESTSRAFGLSCGSEQVEIVAIVDDANRPT
jgi:hypothetical protein